LLLRRGCSCFRFIVLVVFVDVRQLGRIVLLDLRRAHNLKQCAQLRHLCMHFFIVRGILIVLQRNSQLVGETKDVREDVEVAVKVTKGDAGLGQVPHDLRRQIVVRRNRHLHSSILRCLCRCLLVVCDSDSITETGEVRVADGERGRARYFTCLALLSSTSFTTFFLL
jgi:hypothetical protein